KPEVRSQKQGARSKEQEARNKKPEARSRAAAKKFSSRPRLLAAAGLHASCFSLFGFSSGFWLLASQGLDTIRTKRESFNRRGLVQQRLVHHARRVSL